jgi:hypothetical protein
MITGNKGDFPACPPVSLIVWLWEGCHRGGAPQLSSFSQGYGGWKSGKLPAFLSPLLSHMAPAPVPKHAAGTGGFLLLVPGKRAFSSWALVTMWPPGGLEEKG